MLDAVLVEMAIVSLGWLDCVDVTSLYAGSHPLAAHLWDVRKPDCLVGVVVARSTCDGKVTGSTRVLGNLPVPNCLLFLEHATHRRTKSVSPTRLVGTERPARVFPDNQAGPWFLP